MNYAMNWGPTPNQNIMDWFNPQVGAGTVLSPTAPIPDANVNSGYDWFSPDAMFGNAKTGTGGWVNPALGVTNGLMSGWFGLEKLDIAKQQLAENKRQFNLNFGNQARLTNSRLADRQNRRIEEGRSNMSAEQYLSKYGVNA